MTDRAHIQITRSKHNLSSSTILSRTRRVSNNLSLRLPQVVKVSRHQSLRSQYTDRSEKFDHIPRKVISLPNGIHRGDKKSIDLNDTVQSISITILDSNRTNGLKQVCKPTLNPPVNFKANASYLPPSLQSRQFKCDGFNNRSKNNSQSIFVDNRNNTREVQQWIDKSRQQNRKKKQRCSWYYCACSSVWIFSLLMGFLFLGAIIAVVVFISLTSRETTLTTTTTTMTTATTESPCVPSCTSEQNCLNGLCLNVGYLACTLTWSRPGDGDIVVTTPNNRTINYKNRGPSASTDGGHLDRDDQQNTGPENVYWSTSGTVPPTGIYYVCFEPYLIVPTINATDPITVVYRIVRPNNNVLIFTRTFTSLLRNNYECDSTSTTLVGSFTYP